MTKPCPICKSETKHLHSFNDLILVNNFINDKNKYPLSLFNCKDCDLSMLGYFHPDNKLYDENYLYSGENNKQKTRLLQELYKEGKDKIKRVLEIGGGDGYLHKIFIENACTYINYDPTSIDAPYNIKDFYSGQNKEKFDLIIISNLSFIII